RRDRSAIAAGAGVVRRERGERADLDRKTRAGGVDDLTRPDVDRHMVDRAGATGAGEEHEIAWAEVTTGDGRAVQCLAVRVAREPDREAAEHRVGEPRAVERES